MRSHDHAALSAWQRFAQSRTTRAVTAAGGLLLVLVAVGTAVDEGRRSRVADLDGNLTTASEAHSAVLDEYFERSRTIDLLLAHDSAITQLGPDALPGVRRQDAWRRANTAMAYLETLYSGGVSEACLIAADGHELARVVRGVPAARNDLSADESQNPFFAPTLALEPGEVYQAAPYRSPDTREWVVSNSTPMVSRNGTVWGMLHFEVALASFEPALTDHAGHGFAAELVDTRTGRALLSDGLVRSVGGSPGTPLRPGVADLVVGTGAGATGTAAGRQYSVTRVAGFEHNQNHWAVVVSSRPDTAGWWASTGPLPFAIVAAALLLLAFAGLGLRARHRELRHAGLTDALTGLANRRLLTDRIDQALLLAARNHELCAVLLIDLDRFKEVNDTLGHAYGDELLKAVADRLVSACRASDTVARLGGDEFAVLLPEVSDEAGALLLANRCREVLLEPVTVQGIALTVEASVGVALAPEHGRDSGSLMRAADVAMYDAKQTQVGTVVYDAESDENTPTRLAMLGDLRRALQNDDELEMHYQPKVLLSTDQVHSVEALVRWKHPSRGMVPPASFIPAAEGTGLIVPLTLRTLELAIGQARTWLDAGERIQVAVNLSPRCLLHRGFTEAVVATLERHQLPGNLLRLEVTESTIMADPLHALSVLADLQRLGVALSIDDFGTGYSSMSCLQQLPVDELKIDASFVTHMLANNNDGVLVQASIELAHKLGLSVVAEGIEDAGTVAELVDLGCDVGQGYHLGRPMTAAAMTAWLESRHGAQVAGSR